MITYDYAMIAAGSNWRFNQTYSSLALNFVREKNKHNSSNVHLSTNDLVDKIDNLIVYTIDSKYKLYLNDEMNPWRFNYNLKFLSIKNALQNCNTEYLIYIDSDFQIHREHSEEKMQTFLSAVKEKNVDILSPIVWLGYREGTFNHKKDILSDYVHENMKSFDENFLVLRNNEKLNKFLEKWEELYWLITEKNRLHFAESFEIGISAEYAGMDLPDMGDCRFINNSLLMTNMYWTKQQNADDISTRF